MSASLSSIACNSARETHLEVKRAVGDVRAVGEVHKVGTLLKSDRAGNYANKMENSAVSASTWIRTLFLCSALLGVTAFSQQARAQVRASDLEREPVPPALAEPPAPQPVAPVPMLQASPYAKRLNLLNQQIDEMEGNKPGLGGPIALTVAGFGVSGLLLYAGLADQAEHADSTANHTPTLGPAALVASGFSAAAGLGGAIWWIIRADDRSAYTQRLQALQKQRDRIRWALNQEVGGASASLEFVF